MPKSSGDDVMSVALYRCRLEAVCYTSVVGVESQGKVRVEKHLNESSEWMSLSLTSLVSPSCMLQKSQRETQSGTSSKRVFSLLSHRMRG